MAGSIILVIRHQLMKLGTGTRIIFRQLLPHELVPLFTRGWRAEEHEAGRIGTQESTRETF